MLASGGDDSMVMVWDLLNQSPSQSGAAQVAMNGNGGGPVATAATGGGGGVPGVPGVESGIQGKGPLASWKCEYEVANVSWAPLSGLTGQGAEWVGVCAGRGVWGVKL